MSWPFLSWVAFPVWIFVWCKTVGWFMNLCAKNEQAWWGGMPLWMAVVIPFGIFGAFIAGMLFCIPFVYAQ